MSIEFRKVRLEDKELIKGYLKKEKFYGCDATFANVILWSDYYKVTFAIIEGALVFFSPSGFSYPIGAEDLKKALEALMEYSKEQNIEFRMYNITKDKQEKIEALYPGRFTFTANRDGFDYIYNTSDLIELAGKKYHGKRNHINRFKESSDWVYEKITRENIPDCLAMNKKWCRKNGCGDDESKRAEYEVVVNSFSNFEYLELCGGLIRLNGEVVAFSMGEKINEDVFVVHIEKAFSDVQGAYPMINREFAAHEAVGCKYINREEDLGVEGLRKAKLSYYPAFLLEKAEMTYAKIPE